MDTTAETLPYTCTLVGDELADRVQAWQRVLRRAIDRRVEGSRAVAIYPNDGHLLEQLRGLVQAEASCCSFLEFTLEEREGRIVTELRLREEVPTPMKALILDLMKG